MSIARFIALFAPEIPAKRRGSWNATFRAPRMRRTTKSAWPRASAKPQELQPMAKLRSDLLDRLFVLERFVDWQGSIHFGQRLTTISEMWYDHWGQKSEWRCFPWLDVFLSCFAACFLSSSPQFRKLYSRKTGGPLSNRTFLPSA